MLNKLTSVQHLRGVAAVLVVMSHAIGALLAHNWAGPVSTALVGWGRVGVDIFFVISGFVMVLTTAEKPQGAATAIDFVKARAIRIAPLYWILTTLMVLFLLLAPGLFGSNKFDWQHAIASYLFLPSTNRFTGSWMPVLPPGWTLTYEALFYAVFASLLLLPKRSMIVPSAAIFFVALSLASLLPISVNQAFTTITDPIMLEFVFGCIIGLLYTMRVKVPTLVSALAVAVGSIGILMTIGSDFQEFRRTAFMGVPSAFLVAGAVFLERNGWWLRLSVLCSIGDSSYSLYLGHVFALPLIIKILLTIGAKAHLPGDLACVIMVASSVIAGYLLYLFLERPLTRKTQAWLKRPSHATRATPISIG
ncbi:acyltransferase family protein [Cupriavidus basilensis]|uniref:acyltransferase family protein n=1 Tax=Cupriavidus basilensis TaxID=68895 RepID=UPI0020A6D99A|nr:acyltransferase [Cupriavidus basilensis]MCP3017948.1 acyltransferase [Cupriavidus basilensis]